MKEDDKNLLLSLTHTHKLNIWQQCQKIKETPSLFDKYALHFTLYTTSIVTEQRAFSSNIFSLIVGTFSPYFMTDPTVLMRDVYIIQPLHQRYMHRRREKNKKRRRFPPCAGVQRRIFALLSLPRIM